MQGLHLTADLRGCDPTQPAMTDLDALRRLCLAAVREAGLQPVGELFHRFPQPPGAQSLFAGQKRLKLVTHCQQSPGYQQHLLLEYSAYLVFNQLTSLSYKVRLATVDYAESDGKVTTSRWGFFIEDLDDLAKRNGLTEARVGDRVTSTQLEAQQAARELP